MLYEKIISMSAPDNVLLSPLCMGGFSVAQQEAAQLAKEADKLMEEMAETLAKVAVEGEGELSFDADFVLTKYFMWKDQTNEQ